MKAMRLVFAFVALTLAASAAAQDRERLAELRAQIEAAQARLALSTEQAEQIRPVLRVDLVARIEVLEDYGIDVRDRVGARPSLALRQLRQLGLDLDEAAEQTLEDVRPIFDDEQYEEFRETQQERRDAMRARQEQRR